MYRGNHVSPRSPRRRGSFKKLALIISLALVLCLAVGGTLAWLATQTAPVENTFTPTGVPISIVETVENNQKSAVTVKNDGTTDATDAYIRVTVVANTLDADGNVIATAPAAPGFKATGNWTQLGDYYYYNGIVSPGESTPVLFEGSIGLLDSNGQRYEYNILAESIQVLGGYNGQKPETYAWGVTYTDGAWA